MTKQMKNTVNLLIILALLLGIGLACGSGKNGENGTTTETKNKPKKLESYSFKGLKFSYYLIEKDLSREGLMAVVKEIHEDEPDAQLILVDDESGVSDYVNYVKGISTGKTDVELPKEWADKHIVANLQKFLSGKWMLYKGYGYEEIGKLQ